MFYYSQLFVVCFIFISRSTHRYAIVHLLNGQLTQTRYIVMVSDKTIIDQGEKAEQHFALFSAGRHQARIENGQSLIAGSSETADR